MREFRLLLKRESQSLRDSKKGREMAYSPQHSIKIVTAASLFDGHDVSINIMRRVLQDRGAEVVHLGHNRSVGDVVKTVLQEGAQGVAVSSYQGGHMSYFKYMKDLLRESGADYVKVYGGGGGVIIHEEKKELEAHGIDQIFHPDEGRELGLEGMIEVILRGCDFNICDVTVNNNHHTTKNHQISFPHEHDPDIPHRQLGLALSALEQGLEVNEASLASFRRQGEKPLVLGVTGTGGAGKSSLVDELLQRFLNHYLGIKMALICVDPSKKKTGGALLGDRIRMNSLSRKGLFMRSVASRGSGNEIAKSLPSMLNFCQGLDFDLIIAESSGIGQTHSAITEISDLSLYVMTSEFGAQSQLEKIDMIDYANFIAINKADHRGSQDAYRDVVKQYRRSRKLFDSLDSRQNGKNSENSQSGEPKIPVFLTQASNFNDRGVNQLFYNLVDQWSARQGGFKIESRSEGSDKQTIVPGDRQNYLSEIVQKIRHYKKRTEELCQKASLLGAMDRLKKCENTLKGGKDFVPLSQVEELKKCFTEEEWFSLENFDRLYDSYQGEELSYKVRGREVKQKLTQESLCGLSIPRVLVPRLTDWGDRFRYLRMENVPGSFPYTVGVFPMKREGEDPLRQFAGEGSPEKTNKRFHFLSKGSEVKRLSTAFDSVTLYGQDPDARPDIYGKVGESGVSIPTLDDMKKLYEGFDLCDPKTSVSMTINGPAPMILAFFMNTAIDQQVEKREKEKGRSLSEEERAEVVAWTLSRVRGTVQADILKEDQGQNTCIFSIDFALRMMGDIQQFFVNHKVKNFYSVSISGYHIAEAGANPITQLALTLSNAFTFVEYYLSRGLSIDDFAAHLSFFFSNGLDPEYIVIGRVARRIWAIAMKELYGANRRSQRLKYHIQTSGRSLHSQEMAFNDIRTTLQALVAISDNCNSLHTNAYDEAITTPTEESVRRAQAIQMIINKEFGLVKNENPQQGSYFIEWLTDQVEEAVLEEFLRINERGGVLGAMETQYQRGKIQEESHYYESLKHSGKLPIIGVNTFIDPETLKPEYKTPKIEMSRATEEEKKTQLERTCRYKKRHKEEAGRELTLLKQVALAGGDIFEALMSASRHCTLYQMSQALYEVGGEYRRNL